MGPLSSKKLNRLQPSLIIRALKSDNKKHFFRIAHFLNGNPFSTSRTHEVKKGYLYKNCIIHDSLFSEGLEYKKIGIASQTRTL
jgi:hypothetical protein